MLERVCNSPGIPGLEDAVQDIAAEVFQSCCDEVSRDAMGNVIAIKKAKDTTAGQRPIRVLVTAHADEIGFMLKHNYYWDCLFGQVRL